MDAHPDVNLPYDDYKDYHAACMGMGDEEIMNLLPRKVEVSKVLIVSLRSWDEGMEDL